MESVDTVHFGAHIRCVGAGEVVGVFSAGCYISLEGNLILLHGAEYGVVPFGLAFDDIRVLLGRFVPVPGMSVQAEDGLLYIPAAGMCIRPVYRRERPICPGLLSDKAAQAAHLALKILAGTEHGCVKGLCAQARSLWKGEVPAFADDLYCRVASRALVQFLPALCRCDEAGMRNGLCGMLGLGTGLTPSMDDFITGFLYASHVLSSEGTALPYMDVLPALVCETAQKKTSAISAAYLKAAAAFDYFSMPENTVRALLLGEADRAADILRVGSNSGADMLTGMYFAFLLKNI